LRAARYLWIVLGDFRNMIIIGGACMDGELVRARMTAQIILIGVLTTNLSGQKITKVDRDRAQTMLHEISSDIKKHYYDPTFHGVNWDAKIEEAKERINTVDTMNLALSQVAAALDSLNDSHTFFLPPSHANHYDYGWRARMIGNHCFILRVRPGSDADKKGVKPGDELVTLNGFTPTRQDFWKIEYVFNTLRPQPALRLVLRDPSGKQRQLDVVTNMVPKKRAVDLTGESDDIWDVIREEENEDHLGRARFVDLADDVGILKFPGFDFSETEVENMIGKARKHKALILDLRGNPGGSVETLKHLIAGVFEDEVKIGDRIGRSEHKPLVAKAHGHPFTGKLVVLMDSESASASELFARVMQIEKRGTILGDRSSGSVMESKHYDYKTGADTVVFYGASITDADLIMTDGKSLEHNGVLPDEAMLPTAEDIANGRDPVLAHAAETVGAKLNPEAAGKLFPYEWPPI
jgi:carboxyl-terminal processing protease